ncbi:TatD family hydrolase [bacterium]|nr:TatD family hydrolase [bacterium]
MKFFDTHAHLPMLEHAPEQEIVDRAWTSGVERMVTVATEVANWDSSREAAHRHKHISYSLGLHPHEANHWKACRDQLYGYFQNGVPDKCVAIGEMGLDFHYSFADRANQIECLEEQFALAKKHNLPVIIHCREAFTEVFHSLRKVGLSQAGGVMHCFTGTTPDAKAAIDLGLKISFSGILTFKNAEPLREAARSLPLDEIVLETDCPYLAPIPMRGKPNEPSYITHTAACLATVRGETPEKIAQATYENACQLFAVSPA